jgi:trehalose 6-phosphate synthase
LLPLLAEQDIALVATDGLSAGLPGVHPVVVSQQILADHRDGHCAATLVPLYHGRAEPPVSHNAWREAYRAVNRRYAEVVAGLAAPHGCVWIHDYALQLVPAHLRRLRPDLRIGLFMHAPFPPAELFAQLPGREEVLAGLLAADLVAFQHARSAANFTAVAGQHHVLTLPLPADTRTVRRLAADPRIQARAAEIREALHSPGALLLSIADRDSGDGVRQQLDAYAQLLTQRRLNPRRTSLIHLAAAKADTPAQRRLRADLERRIAQINGAHSQAGRCAIHYLRGDLDLAELVAYYVAADVLLATAPHPGSAMTACEYAAARLDGTGRTILSELSATVTELPCATTVNRHDTDALARAIAEAAAAAGKRVDLPWQAGDSVIGWAARLFNALPAGDASAMTFHRVPVPATGSTAAHSAGVRATLGSAERQTPRGPASHPDPDGLTVAAPRL